MDIGLISVVVPVYNVEKYVAKCMDSLISQTYSNIEIIMVDDGSKDSSGAICDEYAKKDPRIIVFHKENGGLSDARNYGIKRAKGKHISFVDSDDEVSRYYIEDLIIDDSEDYISVSHPFRVFEGKKNDLPQHKSSPEIRKYTPMEAEVKFLQSNVFVSAWGKLYPTKLFDKILYPVGEINEDKGTTYKLYAEVKTVYEIEQYDYYYLIRGNSLSSSKYLTGQIAVIDKNLNEQEKFFDEVFGAGTFEKYITYKRLSTYLYFIYHINCAENKADYAQEKRKMVDYVNKYKWSALLDKKSSKRAKLASLAFIFGEKVYMKAYSIMKTDR